MKGKIAIIGAGNMGGAIIQGISKSRIIVTDKRKARLRQLKRNLMIKTVSNNKEAVKKAGTVILAVKPQDVDLVLKDIANIITTKKLVISIAAGVTTKKIESKLKKRVPVIRVMPNTPALIGMGMSVLCPGRYTKAKHIQIAKKIFFGMGEVITLKKEKLMDAVTAVSGSGPAYVYLFIESLIKSANKLGLRAIAEELVLQTLKGAVGLLEVSGKTPGELRKQVTSPGGTTEAALKVFQKKRFQSIIDIAVNSAHKRSKELSK